MPMRDVFATTHALTPVGADRQTLRPVTLRTGDKVVIGRDVSCDLRIDSLEISRRHAILNSEDNHWFITDLESTNGLYINDRPVIAFTPYCLTIGDKIAFGPSGQTKVIYKFEDELCARSEAAVLTPKRKRVDDEPLSAAPKRQRNEWQQLFDSELSCSICQELFVSPVSLNCSHTFCHSCIEQWKHSNDNKRREDSDDDDEEEAESSDGGGRPVIKRDTNCCPVCRQLIVSQNRVLVLDNTIDYIVEKWSPKLVEHRKRLIEERKRLTAY
ncbi:unnamed protein product [Medioppia subpectinata]|uniref:E3 ubiquitin-protein ligase CHFR n=1 Tax=Medioppia subpectinata TaxID=1979941 RepID=A0A7R9KC86_9ACAR|nr:unnamed protein product [Medioppia subpectinata]CAG2100515.1 unnamed protein product [Medioppia subpectinata]